MNVTFEPMPREDVLGHLGPHWPPAPGSTVVRVLNPVDVTNGAITVREADDKPGVTWWVVDGLLVPQGAGPAVLLPGCALETVPEPAASAPPLDTP
ncbi:hypothetical protein [Streptomyces umbrinus]|uniref:hypothetical protein n=1 Tax=Streptomyces umbrinus TaxID=67370 RepID=UPI003C2CC217